MFNHTHYVPILKCKQGEIKAVELLGDNLKGKVSPLFNFTEVDIDYKTKKPKKSDEKHIVDMGKQLAKLIRGHKAVFIDILGLSSISEGLIDSQKVINFFESIGCVAERVIPVAGIIRDRKKVFNEVVSSICKTIKTGICLRLTPSNIEDMGVLAKEIEETMLYFNIKENDCDILIDLEGLKGNNVKEVVQRLIEVINNFPKVGSWRTFILASSYFPSSWNRGENIRRERLDFKVWLELLRSADKIVRMPSYSDYAIQDPYWKDSNSGFAGSVTLRYATVAEWILYKGTKPKADSGDGYYQFNKFCKDLITKKEYAGADYSWGDRRIDFYAKIKKAYREEKVYTGGSSTWRQIGFNRHLTVTVNQLSGI